MDWRVRTPGTQMALLPKFLAAPPSRAIHCFRPQPGWSRPLRWRQELASRWVSQVRGLAQVASGSEDRVAGGEVLVFGARWP